MSSEGGWCFLSARALPNLLISFMCLRRTRELPIWCELFRRGRCGQERTAVRKPAARAANSGQERPLRGLHQRCVRCDAQTAAGRKGSIAHNPTTSGQIAVSFQRLSPSGA